MDDPGTLAGCDVFRHEYLPGVLGAVRVDIRIEVPDAVVVHAVEIFAEHRPGRSVESRGDRFVAEVLVVCGDSVGGKQVLRDALCGTIPCAEWPARYDRILDLWADGEGHIGRQGPRRGGPGNGAHRGESESLRLWPDQRERHRDGLVLAHPVYIVVHAQFVV